MLTTEQITEIANQVLAPLYKLFPSFEDCLAPKFDGVSENEVCFLLRGHYFRCYQESSNRWTIQSTRWVTKKGKPDKRHMRASYSFKPESRYQFIPVGYDLCWYGHMYDFLHHPALFRSWADAFSACVFQSLKSYIAHDTPNHKLLKELEGEKERLIQKAVASHISLWYFSVPHNVSASDAALITHWLSYAGAFPLTFTVSGNTAAIDCRNREEADYLISYSRILQTSSISAIQFFVKGEYLGRVDVRPQDRRTGDFAKTLLQTHREILEAGSMAIADVIRLYCRNKEEAIALHDGRWDLCERAQEMQLPQQFELYYFSDDQKPQLFKAFSMREGLLVKELQHREIAEMFQNLDIADNP